MKWLKLYLRLYILIVFSAAAGCGSLWVPRDTLTAETHRIPETLGTVARIENAEIPSHEMPIPVRIYTPAGSGPFPLVVYFHGGGWVFGGLDTNQNVCRVLSNTVGCIVISVDYRLAPKYKFPAAVEDAYAAVRWARENAGRIQGDNRRIAVCGDSAGGNLAAAVCLMARDRNGPHIAAQVLAYPALNLSSFDTESYRAYGNGDSLTRDQVEWFRAQYLRNEADRKNPYASPLIAEDLRGLPPALVITGEYDVLRDDGEAYAQKLLQQGVAARFMRTPGQGHAAIYWAEASAMVQDVIDAAAETLRQAFSVK